MTLPCGAHNAGSWHDADGDATQHFQWGRGGERETRRVRGSEGVGVVEESRARGGWRERDFLR